ncbi:MAG: endolytic transglycosylase MltG [Alphaproteobacteria bacterium]|nr:endolytic transglycosylase MltG [Alphaproteobacteria bacterium]
MKKRLGVILAILFLAGFLLFENAWSVWQLEGPLASSKIVDVSRGTGLRTIGEQLEKEQVISCRWAFAAAVLATGQRGRLQAGEYEFPKGISLKDVVQKLALGQTYQRKITIPEGLTSFEIVALLMDSEQMSGAVTEIPKEGSLLPDTYYYKAGEDRAAKIRQMQKSMQDYLAKAWGKRVPSDILKTPEEVLILASIVEKETSVAAERSRIAGVFINRLRIGMKLQTDPTIIYALTGGKPKNEGQGPLGRRLLTKDLMENKSPYNTYLYAGLPPGPIANPGRAAIDAVLQPEEHKFLYFVADGNGGHVFAETLEAHNQNVAKWRSVRDKP